MNNEFDHWASVVDQHFAEDGVFSLSLCSDKPNGGSKEFTIVRASVPRFFHTLFSTQVESLQISVNGAKTESIGSNTRVKCERARFTYVYKPAMTRGCPIEVSLCTDAFLFPTN